MENIIICNVESISAKKQGLLTVCSYSLPAEIVFLKVYQFNFTY